MTISRIVAKRPAGQAAIDAMLSYLHTHPETDVIRYADALADILLAAMTRQHGGTKAVDENGDQI